MENELNKWIKQKCAHFTMIPFGLEDLGEMTEVSKFKKGEDIMPLVTSTEMFKKAYDGGYAIGAFNVNNMRLFVRLIILLGRKRA